MSKMIDEGKSLEEIIVTKLTTPYDKIYYDHSILGQDGFITNIYWSLTNK